MRKSVAVAAAVAGLALFSSRDVRGDCTFGGTEWSEAKEAVRLFYRCLLGEEGPACKGVLGDGDSPTFGKAADGDGLGGAWRYFRKHSSLLLVQGIAKVDDVGHLKMRADISEDAFVNGNIVVVIPDMALFKKCGVVREVTIPLLRKSGASHHYVIVASGIAVNGVALEPWLDLSSADAREREQKRVTLGRALCPARR